MKTKTLSSVIGEYLDWHLGGCSETRNMISEHDLADRLERDGYCQEPFSDFEYALCCPINKRKEDYCYNTHCRCHKFCIMLRKEGYLTK